MAVFIALLGYVDVYLAATQTIYLVIRGRVGYEAMQVAFVVAFAHVLAYQERCVGVLAVLGMPALAFPLSTSPRCCRGASTMELAPRECAI